MSDQPDYLSFHDDFQRPEPILIHQHILTFGGRLYLRSFHLYGDDVPVDVEITDTEEKERVISAMSGDGTYPYVIDGKDVTFNPGIRPATLDSKGSEQ